MVRKEYPVEFLLAYIEEYYTYSFATLNFDRNNYEP
jgi:hypothetical protein